MAMESIGYIQGDSLVREAQSGNQAAFAQLVHTYDQTVLRLALRLTGSESDAQDIPQETFLRVYKKLDGFPVRVLFRYLDLPHCHQRLPGSPAKEASP